MSFDASLNTAPKAQQTLAARRHRTLRLLPKVEPVGLVERRPAHTVGFARVKLAEVAVLLQPRRAERRGDDLARLDRARQEAGVGDVGSKLPARLQALAQRFGLAAA